MGILLTARRQLKRFRRTIEYRIKPKCEFSQALLTSPVQHTTSENDALKYECTFPNHSVTTTSHPIATCYWVRGGDEVRGGSEILMCAIYHTSTRPAPTATQEMAIFLRPAVLRSCLPRELPTACTISLNSQHFSIHNRLPPNCPGHVPLKRIERARLAVASAVMSLLIPRRRGTSPSSAIPIHY